MTISKLVKPEGGKENKQTKKKPPESCLLASLCLLRGEKPRRILKGIQAGG